MTDEATIRTYPNPDRAGLVRVGQVVRRRLDALPAVERLPPAGLEIWAVKDFLSAPECEALCVMIDRTAQPSAVYDHGYGANYRTSASGNLDPDHPFVAELTARIDKLLGFPPGFGEPIQGQRYTPGQEFKPHFDWFYTLADYWKTEAKRGGQRSITAMAYLNTVDAGGATAFPNVGLSVPPQPGTLLLWNNATREGHLSAEALHAGTPVDAGTKYVITRWYRVRKFG
jgi:prolyl 4-hydroxylase